MTIEEQVMEVREKQAFWQGVLARRCEGRNRICGVFCRVGNPDLLHRSNRGRAEMSVIKAKPLSCGAERLWVSSVGTDRDLMIVCRNHRCTVYQI